MSERTPVGSMPAASPSTTRREEDIPPARTMWIILVLVLVADALDLLDATITNIAAPTIVDDIGGGPSLVKWLGAAYALALGTLLVIGGRLGDRYGQRQMFLIGLVGFTAASALCGLAADATVLVAFRVLQGAFGALLIPQGMAIMTKTFPKPMLTRALNAFGPLLGIAAVGGPVLAGVIIDADLAGLGWRPIFLLNVVIGALCLVVALRVLPRDDGDPAARLDASGSVLLALAMLGLLFGLIDGSSDGWTALPIAALGLGTVALAGFARRQATATAPLIKPTLLRNRGFAAGLVMGLLFFAAINGLLYVVSLFLQLGRGDNPTEASLGLLPATVGIIIGSGACMALIGRLGRGVVLVGLIVTSAGAALMVALVESAGTDIDPWALAAAILTIGVGAGACFGAIFNIALGDVDPDEAGAASGSLSAVQQIAAAIGSASITSVYLSRVEHAGQGKAMTASLLVVLGIAALCLAAVWLLPRRAVEELQ